MKLNLSSHSNFVPSWNDNHEDQNPIKIEYKRITGNLAGKLMRIGSDQTGIFDYPVLVKECVTKIENLEINGLKIDTAEKLLNAVGTHALVTEIGAHILADSQVNSEIEKKNQDSGTLE